MGVGKPSSQLGRLVCNSVVFTWAFVEMLAWFWVSGLSFIGLFCWKARFMVWQIFVKLRDERREMMVKKEERRKAEEDRL